MSYSGCNKTKVSRQGTRGRGHAPREQGNRTRATHHADYQRDDRRLERGKTFDQLDLNQGYNQLELAPGFRYITTYMGLMRYKRLNFGISSAPEIFQNVIRGTLEGTDGAKNIRDDTPVFGKLQEEDDQHLRAVLQDRKSVV